VDWEALVPGMGTDAEMGAAHARRMLMRFEHASTRECQVAHRAPRARRSGSKSCAAWRSKSVILCMDMHIGYWLALREGAPPTVVDESYDIQCK
jgi:hypothetical protein